MARFLAYAMVFRGDDSWGASNGHEVIKEVGPITCGFAIPPSWREGIFHTRGASVGAVTQRNAHPFVVEHEGRKVIGIHNGGVSNWEDLNRRYQRDCQVDSEHIFRHLAERRNLGELFGRGTIIWYDIYDGRQTIHLARWNYGDLQIAKLKKNNGIVFCSEKLPIMAASSLAGLEIETFYQPLVDGFWHVIEKDGEVLAKGQSLGFENKQYAYSDHRSWNWEQWQREKAEREARERSIKRCRRCHQQEVGKKVICENCWKILRSNFEADQMKKAAAKKDIIMGVPKFQSVN